MAGEKAIEAFLQHKNKKDGNTVSEADELRLFGNTIAEWRDGELWITNDGWFTRTTKDRLCKLGVRIHQEKGKWFLFGKIWDGDWINISKLVNL